MRCIYLYMRGKKKANKLSLACLSLTLRPAQFGVSSRNVRFLIESARIDWDGEM